MKDRHSLLVATHGHKRRNLSVAQQSENRAVGLARFVLSVHPTACPHHPIGLGDVLVVKRVVRSKRPCEPKRRIRFGRRFRETLIFAPNHPVQAPWSLASYLESTDMY